MTFEQFVVKALTSKGMFESQAKEVLEKTKSDHPEMEGRWNDNINGYPGQMLNILMFAVNFNALEYIKTNCPEAWFRPMFDSDHPLRKQFEAMNS